MIHGKKSSKKSFFLLFLRAGLLKSGLKRDVFWFFSGRFQSNGRRLYFSAGRLPECFSAGPLLAWDCNSIFLRYIFHAFGFVFQARARDPGIAVFLKNCKETP